MNKKLEIPIDILLFIGIPAMTIYFVGFKWYLLMVICICIGIMVFDKRKEEKEEEE